MEARIQMVKDKKIFEVTIWPAKFWQHFGSDFIIPAETLSYQLKFLLIQNLTGFCLDLHSSDLWKTDMKSVAPFR